MVADSSFAKQYCQLCADVCEWCASQCDEHKNKYCKLCAESCRRCMEECRKIAAA
ncbi:four-helix bundle copper-binding protein [Sediminicola sp. 1XM1-17]|uniref:four-helix bundle copper-binding protein n=1 Tax=Sediminicola sp. 1XM1-17 TaxID=3127702 RepID=UPI003077D4B7